MHHVLRVTSTIACLLALAGCSSREDAGTPPEERAAAACTAQVTVGGTVWVAIPIGHPMDRRTGESEVDATREECVDVKIQGETDAEGGVSNVTLETIDGVSPSHGLFLPEPGWEDQVWVPESVTRTPEDLPADVRELRAG